MLASIEPVPYKTLSPGFNGEGCALLLLQQEGQAELNDVLHTAACHTAEALVHVAHSDRRGQPKRQLQVKAYDRQLQQQREQQQRLLRHQT